MTLMVESLAVDLKTTNYRLSDDLRTRMQPWIEALATRLQGIPQSHLEIHMAHHGRSESYNAELTLKLPGRRLFIRRRDVTADQALERAFTRLQRALEWHLDHLNEPAIADARRHEALETDPITMPGPDVGPVADAANAGDYRRFRTLLSNYEIWLNRRVGRLVQRDERAEAEVGAGLLISDVVEEVYLSAFESFTERPAEVSLHEWLESWIGPSIRALLDNDDSDREAVSFARSLQETGSD